MPIARHQFIEDALDPRLKPNSGNRDDAVIKLSEIGKPRRGQRYLRKAAQIDVEWPLPQCFGLGRAELDHARRRGR